MVFDRRYALVALGGLALLSATSQAAAKDRAATVVLIGGSTPHGPGTHDYRRGVAAIAELLRGHRAIVVRAYPDGWPDDPAALDNAATIVGYFDGLEHHPLLDPARRAMLARAMARGW